MSYIYFFSTSLIVLLHGSCRMNDHVQISKESQQNAKKVSDSDQSLEPLEEEYSNIILKLYESNQAQQVTTSENISDHNHRYAQSLIRQVLVFESIWLNEAIDISTTNNQLSQRLSTISSSSANQILAAIFDLPDVLLVHPLAIDIANADRHLVEGFFSPLLDSQIVSHDDLENAKLEFQTSLSSALGEINSLQERTDIILAEIVFWLSQSDLNIPEAIPQILAEGISSTSLLAWNWAYYQKNAMMHQLNLSNSFRAGQKIRSGSSSNFKKNPVTRNEVGDWNFGSNSVRNYTVNKITEVTEAGSRKITRSESLKLRMKNIYDSLSPQAQNKINTYIQKEVTLIKVRGGNEKEISNANRARQTALTDLNKFLIKSSDDTQRQFSILRRLRNEEILKSN